jgi:transcriptional regulator with XRE-family HTH domain
MVGLHFTHISRYERGLSQPSTNKLQKLGEALGVTADYLIEGKINEVAQSKLEDKDLLRMFKEIETFQDKDKSIIKELLDAFITKKKIQSIVKA